MGVIISLSGPYLTRDIFSPAPRQVAQTQGQVPFSDPAVYAYFPSHTPPISLFIFCR